LLEQAEQALSLAKKQYEIGVITNLDLLDPQTSHLEANLTHLRALYQMILSRYGLEKLLGVGFGSTILIAAAFRLWISKNEKQLMPFRALSKGHEWPKTICRYPILHTLKGMANPIKYN